jgi:dolichyl-phosphate beta-glucosyltransferase
MRDGGAVDGILEAGETDLDVATERPQLSVVIPAYDEAARIGPCVETALAHFKGRTAPSELIVVSDGSRDGTSEVARKAGGDRVRVISYATNRGKGYAVRTGMLAARGEYVLFSDVDFSTPLDAVESFIERLEDGYDIAVGSRALPDSDVRVRQPWWRQSMGRTFNRFVRAGVGFAMRDTQCGFKCFRADAARAVFTRAQIDRYAFDVEILLIAHELGLRVAELPVVWIDHPHSKVHPIRDSLRMLIDLAALRRRAAREPGEPRA